MIKVKIINNSPNQLPEYKTDGSSGMDIRACINDPVMLFPRETRLIPSGIRVDLPDGYEIQIRPRSGLSLKGITAELGTIDNDYHGDIGIILNNRSNEPFRLEAGMRIAQMIFAKVERVELEEVSSFDRTTARDTSGYGSTGLD